MTDETSGTVTPMPTPKLEEYLEEHTYTNRVREAHPIDSDVLHEVCDTKMGPALLEYDLALIQAVALREVLPYSADHEHWITSDAESEADTYTVSRTRGREGTLHYYQVSSRTFYEILTFAYQRYDGVRIEIDDVADIAEAHTRQYLKDVHGYEGDFGGQVANESIDKVYEPTLCNAYNDSSPQDGKITFDTEPDNAHYAFTDSRGLVIEAGTHPE